MKTRLCVFFAVSFIWTWTKRSPEFNTLIQINLKFSPPEKTMELRRTMCIAMASFVIVIEFASGNFVFKVQHKFAGKEKKLDQFKSHDTRRHSRMLASVDLPLGGDSRVDSVGFCSYPLSQIRTICIIISHIGNRILYKIVYNNNEHRTLR